jgi:hypothetical protein
MTKYSVDELSSIVKLSVLDATYKVLGITTNYSTLSRLYDDVNTHRGKKNIITKDELNFKMDVAQKEYFNLL